MNILNFTDNLKEYKEFAATAARELRYPKTVVDRIYDAENEYQIQRIMTQARQTYIEKEY